MQIKMIGIDHNRADLSHREQFSFTKAGAISAMKQIKKNFSVDGCVILSTCNRTELWLSVRKTEEVSPLEMICFVKGIEQEELENLQDFFVEREGEEAILHLMELACGLDSKIFGEDQIITQVKEALSIARDYHCVDMAMEKLFQAAVTAAKKVKSSVRFTTTDQSTATSVIHLLKEKLNGIRKVPCLIIGNGKMAKLIASELTSHGADVTMTLRKKFHGSQEQSSELIEGCHMLPYEDRLSAVSPSKVIISATLSPHYTLKRQDIEGMVIQKDSIWIDLAVPRDMEPSIGEIEGIHLFDIDTLGGGMSAYNQDKIESVEKILKEEKDQLVSWFAFRPCISQIKTITKLTAEDVIDRLGKPMEELGDTPRIKEELQNGIFEATEKAVGKILYGLRDTLQNDLWKVCMESIEEAARKDTIKTGSSKATEEKG